MQRTLLAPVLALVLGTPAFAGIVDSPLPVLEPGKSTVHLYSVPGIVELFGLSTYYSCTSTDSATVRVGVEAFGNGGGAPITDAAATSLPIPPGGTATFGGSPAAGLSISSDLNMPLISKGSARILATSKKVVCTAFVADTGSAPPASGWQLTIIAKTKQKAAN